MTRMESIDLGVNIIFSLAALYAIYRVIKWILDFKITIKINDLVMEQENGGYRKGYGGPLIDRAHCPSEVLEERGIKLVDRRTGKAVEIDPEGMFIDEFIPVTDKGSNYPNAEYDHLFHLLHLAKKFDTLCVPKLEKAVLKELQIFAKAYRLEIGTEVVGSDIEPIPRRPSRPTFDQPKPRI